MNKHPVQRFELRPEKRRPHLEDLEQQMNAHLRERHRVTNTDAIARGR
jgi:hypothetical protein